MRYFIKFKNGESEEVLEMKACMPAACDDARVPYVEARTTSGWYVVRTVHEFEDVGNGLQISDRLEILRKGSRELLPCTAEMFYFFRGRTNSLGYFANNDSVHGNRVHSYEFFTRLLNSRIGKDYFGGFAK